MHTLLGLSSLLLVVLGAYLALFRLRRLRDWSSRRDVQLLVLAAPVVSLTLAVFGVHHFAGEQCFLSAPPWDYTLGVALPLGMGVVALGALVLGLVRLGLMHRVVARAGTLVDAEVQGLANRVAERMELGRLRRPRVRLCAYDQPLALTAGVLRPTVLLSTWMVEHLDQRELESVLAHELGHVARRDWFVTWLAVMLRDAFFYLPTSWAAFRQLQDEKELACDDVTVAATDRPLALASALAKVWQYALGTSSTPAFGLATTAQSLVGNGTTGPSIELRIERLLESANPAMGAPRSQSAALMAGSLALAGLLVLQAASTAVLLAPMGCELALPFGPLGRAL